MRVASIEIKTVSNNYDVKIKINFAKRDNFIPGRETIIFVLKYIDTKIELKLIVC